MEYTLCLCGHCHNGVCTIHVWPVLQCGLHYACVNRFTIAIHYACVTSVTMGIHFACVTSITRGYAVSNKHVCPVLHWVCTMHIWPVLPWGYSLCMCDQCYNGLWTIHVWPVVWVAPELRLNAAYQYSIFPPSKCLTLLPTGGWSYIFIFKH